MAACAIGAPAVYAIHVMAAGWTPWHTGIVLAIGGAVAWRTADVAGRAVGHALYNRQRRDDSRTTTMIEGIARPALTDAARAGLLTAQTDALRAGMDAARVPVTVERRPRISVWGEAVDDETGGWNDDVD